MSRYAKKQEDTARDEEKSQPPELTEPEVTNVVELVGEDMKTVIKLILHVREARGKVKGVK